MIECAKISNTFFSLVFAPHLCSGSNTRKRTENFDNDANEWHEGMDLLHQSLYYIYHPVLDFHLGFCAGWNHL